MNILLEVLHVSVLQDHGRCGLKLRLHERFLTVLNDKLSRVLWVRRLTRSAHSASLFVKQCHRKWVCEIWHITDLLKLMTDIEHT
jgi:hypothetical protein